MKGSEEAYLVILGMMVALIFFIIVIRSQNTANTPEAKAFEIAQLIALRINELTAVEQGQVMLEFEDEYTIAFGNNKGVGVWFKQVVVPKFLEPVFLSRLTQQTPQGVYVIVEPVTENKKEGAEQYAYVMSYSLLAGDLKEPVLGKTKLLCITKEDEKDVPEVSLC